MNIACNSCPAKYAVPDEKVRGRKVRITCKRCGTAIVVDGTALPAASATTDEAPKSERERQRTILGGLQAPFNSAPGAPLSEPPPPAVGSPAVAIPKPAAAPKAAAAGAFAFPSPGKAAATGAKMSAATKAAITSTVQGVAPPAPGAPAPAEPKGAKPAAATAAKKAVEPPWTVAVTDDDHRDMNVAEIVAAYAAKTVDAETFIWRDGMADWLTPFEIPEIAHALAAKGLTARTNEAPAEAQSGGKSGAWHEPGKWEPGEGRENAFEDVTVAMAAPKAQALLDAVNASENAAKKTAADKSPKPKAVEPVTQESIGFGLAESMMEDEPEKVRPAAGAPAEAAPFQLPFETQEPAAVVTSASPARAAVVARRAERAPVASGPDLFAQQGEEAAPRARMPSIPPEAPAGNANLTGARNESSVLFSLDQLSGGGSKAKPKARPNRGETVDADALLFGGSGGDKPSSMATLGSGGALFAPATMAAPDVMAPPPVSAPRHASPSSAAPEPKPAKKSKAGLWLVLGLVALAAGGAAAVFVLKPHAAPAEAPSAVETAEGTASAFAAVAAPSAAAPEAPSASAAPASSASSGASAAQSAAPAAAAAPKAATAAGAPPAAGTPPVTAATTPGTAAKPATAAATTTPAKPVAAAAAEGADFDREAASAALASAASNAQAQCASQDGTHGTGKVAITFAPSGRAMNALVSGDFAGSALGGCIARVFRSAHVPAFGGDPVRVSKTVRIP